jgi:bifunctional DNA-binding transcriptional regulator/antitoxin component of YhaV-PrlF toxin-antitoxin module
MSNTPDSYEIITQEDPETGDIIIPLPPMLLKQMGLKEGDTVDFSKDDQGRIIVTKSN